MLTHKLVIKYDPPFPYINRTRNITIRIGTSQKLANRLTTFGLGQAGRKQRIELALQARVEALSDREAPDTPVIDHFEHEGFAVVIVFGVVVTGTSRFGRITGDYYFLTLCEDEVDAVLRTVFKQRVGV